LKLGAQFFPLGVEVWKLRMQFLPLGAQVWKLRKQFLHFRIGKISCCIEGRVLIIIPPLKGNFGRTQRETETPMPLLNAQGMSCRN